MSVLIKSTLAASALAMAATAGFAGSMDAAAPEPVVTTAPPVIATGADWTGGYVGGTLGYGWGGDAAEDVDGEVYGIHGGYTYDFGSYVVGGELEYLSSGMEDAGVEVDDLTRVKLRAGYDAGQFLVYGLVGATHMSADGGSDTGVNYGVGVDYAVTDSWTAGVELVQDRINNFDGSGDDVTATTLGARMSLRF